MVDFPRLASVPRSSGSTGTSAPPVDYVVTGATGLVGNNLVALVARREPPVNSAAVGMSLLRHNFSCARAETELGYFYRPLEATVTDAWQWFIDHGFTRPVREPAVLVR